MEPHVPVYLVLALLLVAGNAFFVAAEFAIVKVRTTRIDEMALHGLPGSVFARDVVRHLDEYLSVCQLGITIVSLGLGWIGEEAFAGLLEPLLIALGPATKLTAHTLAATGAFAIITVLHIVLGELVPKSVAIRKPGRMARYAALPLITLKTMFYPVLWVLNSFANGTLRLLGMRQAEEPAVSEAELRLLFAESIRKGVITPSEAEIMDRATRFADRTAKDVMVPLERMVTWSLDRPVEANIEFARAAKHTRYPVFDPARGDLVGVINIKRMALLTEKELTGLQESDVIRDLPRVPANGRIDQVLKEMRRQRQHMAAVIGPDGRAIGVLTMEDIIEEIFGEIEDEFESSRTPKS